LHQLRRTVNAGVINTDATATGAAFWYICQYG
jgi:hypothetical protein